MRTIRKSLVACVAAAIAGAAMPAGAEWPEKPVRILVGAPAGGTADFVARVIGDGLASATGKPFIVEAKPGGLGLIAADALVASPRDGYTIMIAVNGLVSEIPHTLKPRFDPFNDIKPVAEVFRSGLVLVSNAGVPAANVKELVAYVRANPGRISYASYSAGTLSHVMGLVLNKSAGLDLQHVGYKGSPPALLDVVSGQVQLMFDGPPTSVPMLKTGKLKAYAVSSPQRSTAIANAPTFAELGYKELEFVVWMGLWTASGLPHDVLQRLRTETLKVVQSAAVREKFAQFGLDPAQPATPEEMERSLRADHERVGAILKSINYKPE